MCEQRNGTNVMRTRMSSTTSPGIFRRKSSACKYSSRKFVCKLSHGSVRLGNSLENFHSGTSLSNVRLGAPIGVFRFGTLSWNFPLESIYLVMFAEELWLNEFRLGTFIRQSLLSRLRLHTSAGKPSDAIFCLSTSL